MTDLPPTLQAFSAVLRSLVSVASGLLGLAAFAYFMGWKEAQAYFGAWGASWVTNLLSPTRMMQASAWVIWVIVVIALTSVYSLSQDGASHHGSRRWAIGLMVLGLMLWLPDIIHSDYISPSMNAAMVGLAAICFAASAAMTLIEIVARYKEDGFRWHSYYIWLFYFVVLLAFSWAPSRMGESRARLAMDAQATRLPVIELSISDSRSWRLLEVTDSSAILVHIGATRAQNRFKVVPLAELKSISPS